MSGERGARRGTDHAPFDELAVGWALHALEPEDEALFARHLPDCARCARTIAETSDVMAALATDLPQAEPSAGLRDRLRAAVEAAEQEHPGGGDDAPELPDLDDDLEEAVRAAAPAAPRRATGFPDYEPRRLPAALQRTGWRRALPAALAAAAVAAILGLGAWVVIVGDARNEAETVAAQQSELLQQLLQPGRVTIAPLANDGGHSVATVLARQGQMQVVADGLAVNDDRSSVYVVWGMQDGTPVPLGTFDVVRAQRDVRVVGSDQTGLDDYPAYAVSIEPGRSAPSTPTTVVAKGQVTS